ncbi:SusC/RagA family TonB-linked outer membrane protein [Pedobacter sp. L105]|uniref:SusC/RagA family TonB-linked outer membrane protein n=1 Tax=Pedobacter sp. L105 TaxID=1641871 RepID=UPI00131B35E9|nr:SusC/RagA family TonB-linked outer membrane protein [Pedobacter sp. L105]
MKLTTLMLIIALVQASAAGFSQVKLSAKNAPLETVFEKIKKETGCTFFYDLKDVRDIKVTVQVNDATLKETLDKCFNGLSLNYEIKDKTIFVSKKQASFIDKIKDAFTNIDVSGRIVDEHDQSVAGASVFVIGTGNLTLSDAKGFFNLKNVDPNATLVISFIGYEKQELKLQEQMGIIHLKVASNPLDAVQIVAYGQTTERLSTGNISSITAKTIADQPVSNPLLALEGAVPGLLVSQGSGWAGTGVSVRIQGQNSISNGNEPLYVIDGVPYSSQPVASLNTLYGEGKTVSPFNYINPQDIESISVLKDADATSIYGSRAANGAILITTKKGKAGETVVNFNLQNGVGEMSERRDLLNTKQYLQMRTQAFANDGSTPGKTDYDVNGLYDKNSYTNWQDVLLGNTAVYTDMQGTISGGSANTQFLVGVNYHRETTVVPGDFSDTKGSLHFNLNTSSPNNKFKFQLSGSYLFDDNQLPTGDLTSVALNLAPNSPSLYKPDGSLNWAPDANGNSSWQNPLAALTSAYKAKTNNLVTNAMLSYQLLPGLDLKSTFGYTLTQTDEFKDFPETVAAPERQKTYILSSNFGYNNSNTWIVEPQLTYTHALGKGKISFLLGGTAQQNNSNAEQYRASGFSSKLLLSTISAATSITGTQAASAVYRYMAGFARATYNLNDEYLLNLSVRRDGSSRFGSENEFHDFGSVGAGWIFTREKLVQDLLPFLSYGKVTASYGTTGNDQIGDYTFLSTFKPLSYANPYQSITGLTPNGLSNSYLQWELTKKFDVGLAMGFLNDRIIVNGTWFRNRSSNELLGEPLSYVTGFNTISVNLPAEVQNTGLEFEANSVNIKSKYFKWTSSFNITLPHNKLISFPGLSSSPFANQFVIGQSINIVKAYRFAGVNPKDGNYQFYAADGTVNENPQSPVDQNQIINTDPKFYGGFKNTFTYKNLELSIFLEYKHLTELNQLAFGSTPGYFSSRFSDGNQPVSVLNAWTAAGQRVPFQQFSANQSNFDQWNAAAYSDASYVNGSYVRLKNVTLSWRMSDAFIRKFALKSARIYLQGQNLLTFTKYPGLDPETGSDSSLPPLRVMTAGIQLGL